MSYLFFVFSYASSCFILLMFHVVCILQIVLVSCITCFKFFSLCLLFLKFLLFTIILGLASTFSFAYCYFGSCLTKQWNKNLFYLLPCWCYFHCCVVATFVIVLFLFSPLCYYFCCVTSPSNMLYVTSNMLHATSNMLLLVPMCCCYFYHILMFLTYCHYFHRVIGTFVMLLLLPFICTCLCPCSFFVLLFLSCC